MNRQTREELNTLSKLAFGSRSKWQKLVNNGFSENLERDREVMVPTTKGLELKTFTDKKYVNRHYTVEEVRKVMMDILDDRNNKNMAFKAKGSKSSLDVDGFSNTLMVNPDAMKALQEIVADDTN